jgi:hypothetical protein
MTLPTFRSCRVAALLALALTIVVPAFAAPVALVTDVTGDGTASGEPLKLLGEMNVDSEIALVEGAEAIVFFLADGVEYVLKGPGRYRLSARTAEAQGGAAPPQRRQVSQPLRHLRLRTDRVTQGGMVMRNSERPALLQPVRELVITDDVVFQWESYGEGTRYQFELVNQRGDKLLTAQTSDSELRLPAAVPLRAGQLHYWAIRGRDAQTLQAFYRATEFRTADAATRRRIEAARPGPDASFSERALYVALLEDVGAKSAASTLRRQLAAERPAAWEPPR